MTRERELRQALKADAELVLFYQPIVDLTDGSIERYESLVRWQHPRDGLIGPGAFLDVAEETGLIVPIGCRLLDQACRQLAAWARAGREPLYVSVNVSAKQVTAELPGTIAACLREHGVAPRRLLIEMTEHVLLAPEVAVPVLQALRDMGVAIALDDFGTGYSSLSYLETYPLDAVKLDRGFVTRASQPRSAAVLRAAIEMAKALGLVVIAEGIETEQQRTLLRDLGCPLGQGFLWAPALPPEQANDMLTRPSR